jgi:hypothetical protein
MNLHIFLKKKKNLGTFANPVEEKRHEMKNEQDARETKSADKKDEDQA